MLTGENYEIIRCLIKTREGGIVGDPFPKDIDH